MNKIKRSIHFYELTMEDDESEVTTADFSKSQFAAIIERNRENSRHRLLADHEGYICTTAITYLEQDRIIRGQLLKVRTEALPMLMNIDINELKDLDAEENEGLVEISHFMFDYHNGEPIIALEYNQFGPKIQHLCRYLNFFSQNNRSIEKVTFLPIVRDEIASYPRRIQRCSSFKVKVLKDNIARIEEVDSDLFRAIEIAQNFGNSEYVDLFLKFEYRGRRQTNRITDKAKEIARKLLRQPRYAEYFEELKVKAEDGDHDRKLEVFDLISNKVKSQVQVEKRLRSKTIVSSHMFELMIQELNRLFHSDSSPRLVH